MYTRNSLPKALSTSLPEIKRFDGTAIRCAGERGGLS